MTRPEPGNVAGVRVATFNILHGRSPADDQVDVDRFAEAVQSLDADLLGLQEVDRNQPRSQHSDLTATAAKAMGAVDHRFVAALSGTPGATWLAATGDEQPDSAAYGIAFLSRFPVVGWQVVRLPPVPTKVPQMFRGQRRPEWVRDEPRVAVVAEVDAPTGRLRVVTTHLSFLRWWNGRQLKLLMRSVPTGPEPLILMGDLNMGARTVDKLTGMRPLASGVTFPAHAPHEQLDHILTSDHQLVKMTDAVVELPLSDHRALVVDVE
jgi:endonuclease/exonuclease/phosphatase family metal-dependent hydrolase